MFTSEIGVSETESLTINNFFLDSSDCKIFARRLIPKNVEINATFVIVHGFGEHSGLFLNVADHFVKKGYEVLMVDLKGFGYSGSGRENTTIQNMEESVVSVIEEANIGKPLILFGHSMGGLIVTSISIDYPYLNISAIVVEAPFLGMPVGRELPWHKKLIIKYFGDNFHSFVLNSMINITAIAKNSYHIRRMVDDSLVYPFLNLPLIQSMILSIQKAHECASLIKVPYLIVHGVKDQITPIGDSVKIIHNIGSKNKKLVKFQNGYHQLHHDQQQQQMYDEIHKWLQTVSLQPLGQISKTKRQSKNKKSSKIKTLAAIVFIYFMIALKLITKKQFQNASVLQKALSPIIYVLQIIKK